MLDYVLIEMTKLETNRRHYDAGKRKMILSFKEKTIE